MSNEPRESEQRQSKSFGTLLKEARVAKGWEREDVAAQLRLSTKIIIMLEHERYFTDLPTTFLKGYLRAYGKLLAISEQDIQYALKSIKSKSTRTAIHHKPIATMNTIPAEQRKNYLMPVFNYLVIFTVLGLVGVWWYAHPNVADLAAANKYLSPSLPKTTNPAIRENVAIVSPTSSSPTTVLPIQTHDTVARLSSAPVVAETESQPPALTPESRDDEDSEE